jgi:hypothetical protein
MAREKEIKVPKFVTKFDRARMARDWVAGNIDEILERYAAGESMGSIAASMQDRFPMSAWKLRDIIVTNPEHFASYSQARLHRAHSLIDEALDVVNDARKIGDTAGLKVAFDGYIKVASKLAPREYGEKAKVELTGEGGGPVKLLALTDDELMRVAANGLAGAPKAADAEEEGDE